MNGRIAINFRSRGLKNPAFEALGKTQHVNGPMHTRFGGLDRIVLIVNGRSRARQIIDFGRLYIERKCYIMAHQLETRVAQEVLDIAFRAGEKIVGADDLMA